MNHIILKRNVSDTTLHAPTQDEQDSKRQCLNQTEKLSTQSPLKKEPASKQNNKIKNKDQQQQQQTKKKSIKLNKKKCKKFSLDSLTTSEQSLELSIQELIGNETYLKSIENYNQSVQARTNGDDLYSGWKESGWVTDDNPSSDNQHIEVLISALTSFGDGIGLSPKKNWAVVVPFCVPGDVIKTKIYRHTPTHSLGDLITVIKSGELRSDKLIRCKYFGICSGCQFQMIDYSKQLDMKRDNVQRAFAQFSGLDATSIPRVESTLESPKQYEYRTKLTPHFELPRKLKNKESTGQIEDELKNENDAYQTGPNGLSIGLAEKGRRRVVDIEECVIGTKIINAKLKTERARVQNTIDSFKRGATLLLRESLIINDPGLSEGLNEEKEKTICVTDHKTIVREKVLDKIFEQNAGSFFQNNSSILGPFIQYMIDHLIPIAKMDQDQERYLVDAYCGSGLFSISLAHHFTKTIGIELSSDSLFYAKRNAELNNIKNASFIVGEAEAIFKDLTFPSNQTTIIIDPPRKGCSKEFLNQLKEFKPSRIIYVSCNVNTQAQDVNYIKDLYRLERIRGLDFFPQTYHCESVAVLDLIH